VGHADLASKAEKKRIRVKYLIIIAEDINRSKKMLIYFEIFSETGALEPKALMD
tara:strand:+ start:250 stop:411 length:162 start_codon:yes stop_codon:yes gene_type:complete